MASLGHLSSREGESSLLTKHRHARSCYIRRGHSEPGSMLAYACPHLHVSRCTSYTRKTGCTRCCTRRCTSCRAGEKETMFRYGETMDKSPMAKQGGGQKSESLLLGGHPNHLVQASLRLDWIPSVTATF